MLVYQVRGEYPQLSEEEQRREVEFITRHMLTAHRDRRQITAEYRDSLMRRITKVLGFFHSSNFEVPFIIAHRKDHFDGYLDRSDLWKIYDLDAQYHTIDGKKRVVRGLLEDLRKTPDGGIVIDNALEDYLDRARTLEDVADVMSYLNLHFATELQRAEEARNRALKRSVKRTMYEDAKKAGVQKFAKLFNINVKVVAENLSQHSNTFVPEDHQELPDIAALSFTTDRPPYNNPEKVVEAARLMLAQELAAEPLFRQFIRKVYETDAVVTVTPTEKGKREIQPLHPYYVSFL
jgi:transcription elongation factor SPT6